MEIFFPLPISSLEGTASTDANATAPTSGTSAWANWKKQQQRQQRVVGEVGNVFFFCAKNNGLGCKFANTVKDG